jgi:hypothetical protein
MDETLKARAFSSVPEIIFNVAVSTIHFQHWIFNHELQFCQVRPWLHNNIIWRPRAREKEF